MNPMKSSSLNDQVDQTPQNIYCEKGTKAKIQCSHQITNYNQIFWYKQLDDGQLQLLGYMLATSAKIEPGAKILITGDANKGKTSTLTLEEPSILPSIYGSSFPPWKKKKSPTGSRNFEF
uniref:Immunoglobulin V-set domain-containing protein n=1 Tax=Periophthalmus magnuspinnatus TaxID=409849 RepID=A0A3B3ZBS7_9GOBI